MLGEAVSPARGPAAAADVVRRAALRRAGSSWHAALQQVREDHLTPPLPDAADPHRAAGAAPPDPGGRRRHARLLRPRRRHRAPAARRLQPPRGRRHAAPRGWPSRRDHQRLQRSSSRPRRPGASATWSSSSRARADDMAEIGWRATPGGRPAGASPPRRATAMLDLAVRALRRAPASSPTSTPATSPLPAALARRLGMRLELDRPGRLLVQGRVDRLAALGGASPTVLGATSGRP